jgi:hypothetical protein
VSAQTSSPDTSTSGAGRQNIWVSGGVGVGTGGIGVIGSAWYTYSRLVVGGHKTIAGPFWGRDVHDNALLLGVRNLARRNVMLIAVGPARVGGLHHRFENDPSRFVPAIENGVAASAEWVRTFGSTGIGADLFAARSTNRTITGATFSVQLGWFR